MNQEIKEQTTVTFPKISHAKPVSITKGIRTENLVAMRERMRIGRNIANQLVPVHTAQEVADYLGITQQAVSKAEAMALYKVSVKIKELFAQVEAY